MATKNRTTIFSIFGQCDYIAANIMAERHGLKKIEPEDFPPGAPLANDLGLPVSFAIIMPNRLIAEFDQLTDDLHSRYCSRRSWQSKLLCQISTQDKE